MQTLASSPAESTAESTTNLLNPIIISVIRTFETMLECVPKRVGLELKHDQTPSYPLSAIVALTGRINGTIVFSVSESVSLEVMQRLVGFAPESINEEVCDAVGEVANMIAGSAKAQLAHLNLSLGIPNIVQGADLRVHYPAEVQHPMCIHFDSDIGPFMIEFGFHG